MTEHLSTDSYKGVRDFFPRDMAIQRYIFERWSKTAESYGFERYDASILEPSALYRAKGAENEEMVNEQTYTFTDRGNREVTLRPEMTPTVARMVAAAHARRELSFPVRWYSIPNLFRYERPQRGRLREHWQLNCDIFGGDSATADVEIIALAHQLLLDFGASPQMFEIRINDRALMERLYGAIGIDTTLIPAITRLNDRKRKISADEYRAELIKIVGDDTLVEEIIILLEKSDEQTDIVFALSELGITNVVFDKTLARGFDYYTGTIFEIFDVSGANNRSMLGGGRYNNLTSMFGGEPISGVGFGMGDVTIRDFLETHELLPTTINATAPVLTIISEATPTHLAAQKIAQSFRAFGISVEVDYSDRKIGKKISAVSARGGKYVLVFGEREAANPTGLSIKNLASGTETSGDIATLSTLMQAVTSAA